MISISSLFAVNYDNNHNSEFLNDNAYLITRCIQRFILFSMLVTHFCYNPLRLLTSDPSYDVFLVVAKNTT